VDRECGGLVKIEYYFEDGEFTEIDSLPISLPAWARWAAIEPSENLPGMCELRAYEYKPRWKYGLRGCARGQFMLCALFLHPKMVAGEFKDCLWKLEDLDVEVLKIETEWQANARFIQIESLPISLPAWAQWITIQPSWFGLPKIWDLTAYEYEPKCLRGDSWWPPSRGESLTCALFLYRKMVTGKIEDCLWKLEDLET
jgi:hypothetical protein